MCVVVVYLVEEGGDTMTWTGEFQPNMFLQNTVSGNVGKVLPDPLNRNNILGPGRRYVRVRLTRRKGKRRWWLIRNVTPIA